MRRWWKNCSGNADPWPLLELEHQECQMTGAVASRNYSPHLQGHGRSGAMCARRHTNPEYQTSADLLKLLPSTRWEQLIRLETTLRPRATGDRRQAVQIPGAHRDESKSSRRQKTISRHWNCCALAMLAARDQCLQKENSGRTLRDR